ncbi:hypothetical protein J2755_000290 [Methanohalophilus levihalophilus]|uniref:hypothetical protein n=1 Tax=Methanohalophilus levihalophilus TaxID=1431282 RepID=UPI001AE9BA17|nr:hypothetical protein [Methanohalophilus levihalophilus]MBP2029370.1 hypothetical protein [Methanohalophilus levihalophilus]
MDNAFALFLAVLFIATISTGILVLIWYWNPYAIKLALWKKIVWVVESDGTLRPVKANLEALAYRTEKHGYFEFEQEDVVYYAKKPGIIVYGPYSKAIRPPVVPILQKLKNKGVERYDQLMAILQAQEITKKDYDKLLKEQQEKAPQGVKNEPSGN